MMTSLDISAVRCFQLVSELKSFTRAAEALGTTQAAVSMKLQRLETMLGKRLLERSPRSVRLTLEGQSFVQHANDLLSTHDRALAGETRQRKRLALGISDHAAGPALVSLLERVRSISTSLTFAVTVELSRNLIDALDNDDFDAVIVRREGSRRGGEELANDAFGWFAAPDFSLAHHKALPLATIGAPCGVRAVAIRALDQVKRPWDEIFAGGGVSAVVAAAEAGLAIAPLASRVVPRTLIDVSESLSLPRLPSSKVMLYSRVSDAAKLDALRLLAAAFRSMAG